MQEQQRHGDAYGQADYVPEVRRQPNHCLVEDPRKAALKDGLRQLTIRQLDRVLTWPDPMVLDGGLNYEDGRFCPLAVAADLPTTMAEPTHDKVFAELTRRGYSIRNTCGIKGEFYTTHREADLRLATLEVMNEKWRLLLSL